MSNTSLHGPSLDELFSMSDNSVYQLSLEQFFKVTSVVVSEDQLEEFRRGGLTVMTLNNTSRESLEAMGLTTFQATNILACSPAARLSAQKLKIEKDRVKNETEEVKNQTKQVDKSCTIL